VASLRNHTDQEGIEMKDHLTSALAQLNGSADWNKRTGGTLPAKLTCFEAQDVLIALQELQTRAERAEAELAAERKKVKTLHKALGDVKNSICRNVPDGYSQPCVDESADECDRIIDAAMKQIDAWYAEGSVES
jgi:hypothetical protein